MTTLIHGLFNSILVKKNKDEYIVKCNEYKPEEIGTVCIQHLGPDEKIEVTFETNDGYVFRLQTLKEIVHHMESLKKEVEDEEKQYNIWLFRALSQNILVVLVARHFDKKAKAYIGTVPGINHKQEAEDVIKTGSKLSSTFSDSLFKFVSEEGYMWS